MSVDEVKSHRTIKFLSRRSNHFRVVHCDHLFGVTTLDGNISILCVSEAPGEPRTVTHEITPDGSVGDIVEGDVFYKEGEIVVSREVEVCIVMRPEVAARLIELLEPQVQILVSNDTNETEESKS